MSPVDDGYGQLEGADQGGLVNPALEVGRIAARHRILIYSLAPSRSASSRSRSGSGGLATPDMM